MSFFIRVVETSPPFTYLLVHTGLFCSDAVPLWVGGVEWELEINAKKLNTPQTGITVSSESILNRGRRRENANDTMMIIIVIIIHKRRGRQNRLKARLGRTKRAPQDCGRLLTYEPRKFRDRFGKTRGGTGTYKGRA